MITDGSSFHLDVSLTASSCWTIVLSNSSADIRSTSFQLSSLETKVLIGVEDRLRSKRGTEDKGKGLCLEEECKNSGASLQLIFGRSWLEICLISYK